MSFHEHILCSRESNCLHAAAIRDVQKQVHEIARHRLLRKAMFADPRMVDIGEFPTDGARMILVGFESILAYHKDQA